MYKHTRVVCYVFLVALLAFFVEHQDKKKLPYKEVSGGFSTLENKCRFLRLIVKYSFHVVVVFAG